MSLLLLLKSPAGVAVALAGSSAGAATAGPTVLRRATKVSGVAAGVATAVANLTSTPAVVTTSFVAWLD
jgi:hypothetical protein